MDGAIWKCKSEAGLEAIVRVGKNRKDEEDEEDDEKTDQMSRSYRSVEWVVEKHDGDGRTRPLYLYFISQSISSDAVFAFLLPPYVPVHSAMGVALGKAGRAACTLEYLSVAKRWIRRAKVHFMTDYTTERTSP